jgi:hypothetical protein
MTLETTQNKIICYFIVLGKNPDDFEIPIGHLPCDYLIGLGEYHQ